MKPVAPVTKYDMPLLSKSPGGGNLYPCALPAAPLATGEALGALDGGLQRAQAGPRLDREAGLHGMPERRERSGAVGEHRVLRESGEALGVLERAAEVAPGLGHLGEEPDRVRLLGVEDPAGEDDVERPPLADDARQAL